MYESLIKKNEETETQLKETIEYQKKTIKTREKTLITLKKSLDINPSYHTLEYVEEKLRNRLEAFEEKITKKIQEECKTVITLLNHMHLLQKQTQRLYP